MTDGDRSPVVVVENPEGAGPFVFLCDHASNRIPEDCVQFGFGKEALATHIAWDPGALGVTRHLSSSLDAPLVWPDVSRLVIDCNRSQDAASLIVVESEGRAVAANRGLSAEERARRLGLIHAAYHEAIELYYADQLVPQGELFRAVQTGTIDAAQSDDDSAAAPVDVKIFAAYFPFASRYSLDVPTLWHWYGLKEIWEEAYGEAKGVTWLSTGAWDPCNFATTKPVRSVADLKGLRVYMFPTGGQFMSQFGVVPITLPYEDVEVAIQTGELDGVCWSDITEDYTVGWPTSPSTT